MSSSDELSSEARKRRLSLLIREHAGRERREAFASRLAQVTNAEWLFLPIEESDRIRREISLAISKARRSDAVAVAVAVEEHLDEPDLLTRLVALLDAEPRSPVVVAPSRSEEVGLLRMSRLEPHTVVGLLAVDGDSLIISGADHTWGVIVELIETAQGYDHMLTAWGTGAAAGSGGA